MTVEAQKLLPIYLHLAWASGKRQRLLVRDKLLIVAGSLALEADLEPIADYCRHLVLAHNPGHLVGRQSTFAACMQDAQFQHLVQRIRNRYPRERAEHMLNSLGLDLGRERDAYLSDFEYAAALLGTTPGAIDRLMGRQTAGPESNSSILLARQRQADQPLDRAEFPLDSNVSEATKDHGVENGSSQATRLAAGMLVLAAVALLIAVVAWRMFG